MRRSSFPWHQWEDIYELVREGKMSLHSSMRMFNGEEVWSLSVLGDSLSVTGSGSTNGDAVGDLHQRCRWAGLL